jgi:hypothetical protein
MATEMDCLVMGDCLFDKIDQPPHEDRNYWKGTYELD